MVTTFYEGSSPCSQKSAIGFSVGPISANMEHPGEGTLRDLEGRYL